MHHEQEDAEAMRTWRRQRKTAAAPATRATRVMAVGASPRAFADVREDNADASIEIDIDEFFDRAP